MQLYDIIFCVKHLKELVKNNNEQEAGEYIEKFFFNTHEGLFFHDGNSPKWYNISPQQIRIFMPNDITNNKKGIENFEGRAYLQSFNFQSKKYLVDVIPDVADTIISKETTLKGIKFEQKYLNFMGEHKHVVQDIPEYETFSDKDKSKVQLILNHIFEVWANQDDSMNKYLIQWLSFTIMGHKLLTFLYLQSTEGTGKSIIIEFIRSFVLGNRRAIISSTPSHINKWTKVLEGTSLVNINEMPVSSDYKGFNESLKNLTTECIFYPEEKNEKSYSQRNTFNFIITTNKEAIQFDENNKRRIVSLDINESRIGDTEYFNKIIKECMNDECGKCFYAYMRDNYIKDFDFTKKPETKSFIEGIQKRLPLHIKFLKDLIREGEDKLDICEDFYEEYSFWCKSKGKNPSDKINFGKSLSQIEGITKIRKTDKETKKKHNYYSIDIKEMFNFFKGKDYISKYDNIIIDDEPTENTPKTIDYKLKYLELKKELDDLKYALEQGVEEIPKQKEEPINTTSIKKEPTKIEKKPTTKTKTKFKTKTLASKKKNILKGPCHVSFD